MSISNQQVVFASNLYANGGLYLSISSYSVTVAAGQFRDSQNISDIIISNSMTLNGQVNGAGGLDTGSLAAGTFYYVYAIGSTMSINSSTYIISLSSTTPTLPVGYDVYRLIGFLKTDSPTPTFLNCYIVGNDRDRTHYWVSAIPVLTGGSATTVTEVGIGAAAPVIDKLTAHMIVTFTPASAGHYTSLGIKIDALTIGTQAQLSGVVASVTQIATMPIATKLSSSVPSFAYANSNASGSMNIAISGFDYTI